MSRKRNLLIRGAMQRNQTWDSMEHHYRIQKAPTPEQVSAFERERRMGAKDTPSRQTKTRRMSWWARS